MPSRFHVFLSHNSADKSAVEEIGRRLKEDGLESWFDKWHLIPGEPLVFESCLRYPDSISRSTVAAICSPTIDPTDPRAARRNFRPLIEL